MKTVTFNNKTYRLDPHGFLDPPEQWDRAFAEGLARRLEIHTGLTERHWQFISYLRNKFLTEGTVPVLVLACMDNDARLAEFRALFPTGYHRGACKIAGIPHAFIYRTNYPVTCETVLPRTPRYRLNKQGFLENFDDWDDAFPEFILAKLNLPGTVTDSQRSVLRSLREHFATHRSTPPLYKTCAAHGLSLERFHELFPAGYRRGACRMAGLPFAG